VRVAIGSDHAGYELKTFVKKVVEGLGHASVDVGPSSEDPVDFPEFGLEVARLVSEGRVEKGILICGTGLGMTIVANKVKGIRASVAYDLYTAMQSRKHLNANVLVLGGRVTGRDLAGEIVKAWLDTPYEGEKEARYQRRLDQISRWEKEHLS
jgi:RpiB/LacA/LacB family sugar-phosphate isomerase